MASAVAIGIFNAIAFAGASYGFSKLNKHGYDAEMKRHDLAQEKLAKAKEEWYEQQTERKNRLEKLRQELSDANQDINDTNKALHAFRTLQEEIKEEEKKEPTINDFYRPSHEMKSYMNLSAGIIGITGGYLISRLIF